MSDTLGWGALRLWVGLGGWLEVFGVFEIERRPRGASRATLAPTFVSGQLFLGHMRATAFGAWRDIASNKQGGRAQLPQA